MTATWVDCAAFPATFLAKIAERVSRVKLRRELPENRCRETSVSSSAHSLNSAISEISPATATHRLGLSME